MPKKQKIKVLVLKGYKKLKNPGSITYVSRGYAVNYLIPNNIVAIATKEKIAEVESMQSSLIAQDEKLIKEANSIKALLDDKSFIAVRVAGDDDRLFGSITTRDIANDVNKFLQEENINLKLQRSQVTLSHAIKQIGIYNVEVMLHGSIYANIKLNVCRSANDAKLANEKVKKAPAAAKEVAKEEPEAAESVDKE